MYKPGITLLAGIPTVIGLGFYLWHGSMIRKLQSPAKSITISRATNDLGTLDIILVILVLLMKSLTRSLGFGPRLSGSTAKSSNGKRESSHSLDFPAVSLSMLIEIRAKDVQQYLLAIRAEALQGPDSDFTQLTSSITSNNAHLAMFFSAISNPAMLLLLARNQCPINPLGGVNVRNRIRIIRQDLCRLAVDDFKSSHRVLKVKATPEPTARVVKRGIEVDFKVSVTLNDEKQNIKNVEIFEQIFTVLEFRKSSPSNISQQPPIKPKPKKKIEARELRGLSNVPSKELRYAPQLAVYFTMKPNEPKQWARLCKDYNLIHISLLAAKLFGFRSKIAHGNHVVAKAIQALAKAKDEDFLKFCNQRDDQILWMQVEFRRPVFLPSEIGVRSTLEGMEAGRQEGQIAAFEVFKSDKTHVELAIGSHSGSP